MTFAASRLERVVQSPSAGELDGPVWDGAGLLFCSPSANEIWRYEPVTGALELFRHSTSATRSLAFGPDGRLFGAQSRSRRVVWYEAGGATFYLNAMLDGRRHNDPQDLVVDGAGRIWFSDDWTPESIGGPVGWPTLDHRSILRLTRTRRTEDGIGDWRLERMTTDTDRPRGVALSPDEGWLYVTDLGGTNPAAATLRAYPILNEGLGPATVLRSYEPSGGGPARSGARGLCVAATGRLVVAAGPSGSAATGAIEILASDGTEVGRHPIPAGAPTNCAFGDVDGRSIYITTSDGEVYRLTGTGEVRGPGGWPLPQGQLGGRVG